MSNARSYFYSLASSGIALILGLVTSVLVNRFLGPVDRGELASMVFAATTSSGIVFSMISSQAIIWHINRNRSSGGGVLTVTALQTFASIPITFILMMLFHKQAQTSLAAALAYAVTLSVVQTIYNSLCAIHRAESRFELVSSTVAAIPVGYATLLGVFILVGGLTPATTMLANAIPIVVCVIFLIAFLPSRSAVSMRQDVIDCLKHGMAFLPVTLAGLVIASTDRALVLKLGNLQTLGYFVAAAGISSPIAVVAETIVQISFVEVSRRTDLSDARALALGRFRVSQIILLGLGLIVALIGPWFLVTASGPLFAPAVPVLFWLIAAMVFRGMATVLDVSLRGLGLLSYSLMNAGLGFALMILSGVILIPNTGAIGAAQAVFIAYATMFVAQLTVWHWRLNARWSEFWGFELSNLQLLLRLAKSSRLVRGNVR